MDDDMAGGPTRTLARSGSERRPSRRGVNISLELESRFGRAVWYSHCHEDTLWPTIRCDFFLRFRSKKTPPLSASLMF